MTDSACTMLETPKPMLAALVKKEPFFLKLLMEYYKHKTSDSTLARVPLFSFLDPEIERPEIAEHLSPINIRKRCFHHYWKKSAIAYALSVWRVGVYYPYGR